ncbi:hypothetical protein [Tabrizicola sp.]|jgi:hypothetical protein|uniref:hypothetical protein n=1 Tax=Tabrizicola sp. TaxID=2005166 RepID=UPI003D26D1D9
MAIGVTCLPQNAVSGAFAAQDMLGDIQSFPLLPMKSHGIPYSSKDEAVNKTRGAAQDPEQGEKDRLIQATAFVD